MLDAQSPSLYYPEHYITVAVKQCPIFVPLLFFKYMNLVEGKASGERCGY